MHCSSQLPRQGAKQEAHAMEVPLARSARSWQQSPAEKLTPGSRAKDKNISMWIKDRHGGHTEHRDPRWKTWIFQGIHSLLFPFQPLTLGAITYPVASMLKTQRNWAITHSYPKGIWSGLLRFLYANSNKRILNSVLFLWEGKYQVCLLVLIL